MDKQPDIIEQYLQTQKKQQPKNSKIISVAIVGLPNAGKSSIVNKLVGQKISIISPKIQTTRNVIRGIFVEDNTQVVLIDTPGLFVPKKDRLLERKIVKNAWSGILEADVVAIIIDSTKGITKKVETLINDVVKKQQDIIFVLNKVDIIKKNKLLLLAEQLNNLYSKNKNIFMVSAKTGDNLDKFKQYLLSIAKEGNWLFDKNDVTDASLKFLSAEITREKLFLSLENSMPYSVDVYTESIEYFKNGSIKIKQIIRVLKESQKSIILGKNAEKLKKINIESRKELEKILKQKIHLFTFVKVDTKWIEEK